MHVATLPRMRALAWSGETLYASRGYTLLSAKIENQSIRWQEVGRYDPPIWRNLTASMPLTFRLVRDGFHALSVLPSGALIATVPGAIITLAPGDAKFHVTHRVKRGMRPLHICSTPAGPVFFGEYFDNREREEVHIYASGDHGETWGIAHTFPKGAIRHVHNIVYDAWDECLWILTGDNGPECRIMRASCDLKHIETVMEGNQQARSVALVPTKNGVYFSSDTPSESNHVYFLDQSGKLSVLADLPSSSIYGCRVGEAVFFSTMVEPSAVNHETDACLYGAFDGISWRREMSWQKDAWHFRLFQYGNVLLPNGENGTNFLAISTVAVKAGDLQTSVWKIVR